MVSSLPVKKKSLDRKTRWFYYYIVNTQAGVFIRQRQTRDIWQHLYEFSSEAASNVVDVYVGYLRRKIDRPGEPSAIRTVRGAGYVLEARP